METPVLLLVFARPETTAQVFAAIRAARPERLYVAADGARDGREGEAERVAQTRAIATAVDWPCTVETLFREHNLGCKRAVSGGIDWFFSNEPEGIVLEDDTVPLPSFFPYAEAMLERYRDDERVMMINGCNLISDLYQAPHSYFFSGYAHVWGWASWRRAWACYDVELADWPEVRGSGLIRSCEEVRQSAFVQLWYPTFDALHAGKIPTWDYQWAYALLKHGGLATTPKYNLVRNIGFGAGATHTTDMVHGYVRRAISTDLEFPVSDPPVVGRDLAADRLEELHVFGLSWRSRAIAKVLTLPLGSEVIRAAAQFKAQARRFSTKFFHFGKPTGEG